MCHRPVQLWFSKENIGNNRLRKLQDQANSTLDCEAQPATKLVHLL